MTKFISNLVKCYLLGLAMLPIMAYIMLRIYIKKPLWQFTSYITAVRSLQHINRNFRRNVLGINAVILTVRWYVYACTALPVLWSPSKWRPLISTSVGKHMFFFLYIFFRDFRVYVPMPPLRGQHMVLCHPRWLPISGWTEFAMCWGGAGFEPKTTETYV